MTTSVLEHVDPIHGRRRTGHRRPLHGVDVAEDGRVEAVVIRIGLREDDAGAVDPERLDDRVDHV
jgi:hypothetical protein